MGEKNGSLEDEMIGSNKYDKGLCIFASTLYLDFLIIEVCP